MDQALSLPKGVTLLGESGNRIAEKVHSNVSDGMELWKIIYDDGRADARVHDPFKEELAWELV